MRRPILFLAHRVPWPPAKGDKIRSHRWLQALARASEVVVGAFTTSRAEREAAAPVLEELSVGWRLFPRPSRLAAARALLTGRSPSEEVFRSRELRRWVAETVCRRRPAAVVVFSSTMAQHVADLPLPKVLDLVDVDSAKWARYGRSGPAAPLYRWEARRLAARERSALATFDRVLVVSAAEAARLPASPRLEVLPNGVDTERFRPAVSGNRVPGEVVMTGAMDYPPNVEGARWFAEEVLPGLREGGTGATFTIVGSEPSRAVRALTSREGVTVTGTVPDVTPYLARAEVAVAPLLTAFGVQNKVLEAMAAGLPVVATPVAAAGLAVRSGEQLEVASGAGHFRRAVGTLLGDPAARARLGAAARRFAVERCSWEPVMHRMEQIVREVGG